VARLDREVTDRRGAVALRESRYFACSVDPGAVTPRALLSWLRGHRQVENSLHFLKDRWWDEDRRWCRRPGLAERMAVLLDAALNVLRLPGGFDAAMPIRARADALCWDPADALRLFGAST
jgi:hypothetical protein